MTINPSAMASLENSILFPFKIDHNTVIIRIKAKLDCLTKEIEGTQILENDMIARTNKN
jgi:hypothetical protein